MALTANYEFLFVGRDDNSFLENYAYDLFQEHGDKSGQVFVNLEVQNNQADAAEIGQLIFETMQNKFFEDVDADPYERFEFALKEINDVLKDFSSQKFSGYIGNLNVVVAAIVGDVLFLTQTGDAEAYLIRKKYVSVVSEGLSDEGQEGEVFSSIASGKIEPGDFVLFSSTRLLRYVSKTDLAKCVSRKSVVETLNEVKDLISTEILGRIGLTGIIFNEATKEDVENIENEVDTAAKSILESSEGDISVQKETITGRFITAFKSYGKKRKKKASGGGFMASEKSVSSSGGWLSKIGNSIVSAWEWVMDKGFGKDKVLAVLIIVIIILTVGIWVTKSNSATRAELERLDQVLEDVQMKLSEAETKGTYDKEAAKTILDKAYSDALAVLNSGYYREKAKMYLIQIDETRDNLDNVQRIEEPTVFADLSQKRSDVNALGFVEVNDRVFVFEYNALYEIVLDQVQDPVTIDDNETIIAATGFDDRGSVVFLTKSGKLIEYREGTVSFMDTDDGSFRKGVSLADWSNRIYMLDPASNQIWKYQYKGTREKFDAAEPYFVEEVDLASAVDFTIDGAVYTLLSNGDIFKYYGGNKTEFYINNAPFSAFTQPAKIYTDEEMSQVYVLDSAESRVLVFDKESNTNAITYKTQYLFDAVGELRDMYVDAQSGKLYVLTDSKVLEVAM